MRVFDKPEIFNQITVTFTPKENSTGVDRRGNPVKNEVSYQVRFAIFPTSSNNSSEVYGDKLIEQYKCYLLGVLKDGETSETRILPESIVPGEIGEALIEDRSCQIKLDGLIQSSVSPIIKDILGKKYQISVVSWSR